jgi:hypothetical protein
MRSKDPVAAADSDLPPRAGAQRWKRRLGAAITVFALGACTFLAGCGVQSSAPPTRGETSANPPTTGSPPPAPPPPHRGQAVQAAQAQNHYRLLARLTASCARC